MPPTSRLHGWPRASHRASAANLAGPRTPALPAPARTRAAPRPSLIFYLLSFLSPPPSPTPLHSLAQRRQPSPSPMAPVSSPFPGAPFGTKKGPNGGPPFGLTYQAEHNDLCSVKQDPTERRIGRRRGNGTKRGPVPRSEGVLGKREETRREGGGKGEECRGGGMRRCWREDGIRKGKGAVSKRRHKKEGRKKGAVPKRKWKGRKRKGSGAREEMREEGGGERGRF